MHVCTTKREGSEWSSFDPTSLWSLESNRERGKGCYLGGFYWQPSGPCNVTGISWNYTSDLPNPDLPNTKNAWVHITYLLWTLEEHEKPYSLTIYSKELLICSSLAFGLGCPSRDKTVVLLRLSQKKGQSGCSDNVLDCFMLLEIWEVRIWWTI